MKASLCLSGLDLRIQVIGWRIAAGEMTPLVMVTSIDHPAKTVKEFVAWAKANPDKSNYGTSSPAFTLAVELFKPGSGAPITAIPYKSGNEMVIAVMNGNFDGSHEL